MKNDPVYPEGILDDRGQQRSPGEQSADPHPCPYDADINGDRRIQCTCGPAAQRSCSADI